MKDREWRDLLTRLKLGEIPDEQIGSAIVHLAKPSDAARVEAARGTILTFLKHPNAWARHEAMWFLRWASLVDHAPALIEALEKDPDSDNRSYAAVCLMHLLGRTPSPDAIKVLARKVLDESEDRLVRGSCYSALAEMLDRPDSSKHIEPPEIEAMDLDWARSLSA